MLSVHGRWQRDLCRNFLHASHGSATLQVIKALVFFNTFVFANTIFFATQFGPHSCFFSHTGFQGSVPLSWWVSASEPNSCMGPSWVGGLKVKVLLAVGLCVRLLVGLCSLD